MLDGVALGDAGAAALFAGGAMPVVALSLQDCSIGAGGGAAVAGSAGAGWVRSSTAGGTGPGVQTLNLRDNKVGDAGAAALARSAEAGEAAGAGGGGLLKGLRVLDVGCNGVGTD